MSLQKIEILGYRGFEKKGQLLFAIPNGKPGSGLTLITGPNNSGKSSVLECITAWNGNQQLSFTGGKRNPKLDQVEITLLIGGITESITSVRQGSSEVTKTDNRSTLRAVILPSRRGFEPYFGRGMWQRSDYIANSNLTSKRTLSLSGFSNRLFKINQDPTRFNELVEKVLGFKPNWTIDQGDNGQYFLKFFNQGSSHTSDGLGEGIISLFSIIDALYDSEDGDVIAIDEPELSLHPSLQKRLSKLLTEYSKSRQLIISTHSAYFIDFEAIENGGNLSRVISSTNGTEIFQISEKARENIVRLSKGNINNPHVWGLDAKELFFQEDPILITEGQEDVVLFPKIISQAGIENFKGSFFGWGAGGSGNIKLLCKIFEDLGFKKIIGIFDNDKEIDMREASQLFPKYFFCCIPAKDIRDKEARKATNEVSGLMNSNSNLKPEFIEPLKLIFNDISNFINSNSAVPPISGAS